MEVVFLKTERLQCHCIIMINIVISVIKTDQRKGVGHTFEQSSLDSFYLCFILYVIGLQRIGRIKKAQNGESLKNSPAGREAARLPVPGFLLPFYSYFSFQAYNYQAGLGLSLHHSHQQFHYDH